MGDVDPNTGIPMYDPCHMYPGNSDLYSACTARLMDPLNGTDSVAPTPWYDHVWVPTTFVALLVIIIACVGYMAYERYKATK